MNARQVHAVLAAGVQNPGLIERWRAEPGLLVRHGIEPGSFDFAGLWKFAGLTVKVRHNGVRQELPMTFRLLSVTGLEIEVFASYATFCASNGRGYAATTDERVGRLAEFLSQWLDLSDTRQSLVWDMIRHEQALRLLHGGTSSPGDGRGSVTSVASDAQWTAASVPVIRGRLVLNEMRCDPLAITTALRQTTPALGDSPQGLHHFCYWRPDGVADIQVLELDEFGYYLLSFVDGISSAGQLHRRLGGVRQPTRSFMRSLTQLASIGILALRPPGDSHGI